MEKPVSAADANRKFSKLLRTVREGQLCRNVAWQSGRQDRACGTVEKDGGVVRGARTALVKRLRSEPVRTIGRWNRNELYEDKQ